VADLGIITGLSREMALLRVPGMSRPDIHAEVAFGARRAGEAAQRMVARGSLALLSFGIAGGLDPDLHPGALMVPAVVIAPDGSRLETDAPWRGRLMAALAGQSTRFPQGVAEGPLAGAAEVVATPADKVRLLERTGAQAVDMESHAVAGAAAAAGLPFLAIRCVADRAGRALPRAVLGGVGPEGWVRVLSVLTGILRSPGELGGVLALARDSRRALSCLRRVALLAGPRFGL
jgi:adenosylhomocysteine nucleosidase